MKKLTLNKTWKLCLKMWRWIAKEKRNGNELPVIELKGKWTKRHGFKTLICNDCFFCQYAITHKMRVKVKGAGCSDCPGTKVDRLFYCENLGCTWDEEPVAFYKKLLALNRKRKER